MYTLGFAEAVNVVVPSLPIQPLAFATTIVVAIFALISAKAAIRAQYVIMAAIALSLLAFFLGTKQVDAPPLPRNFEPASFWVAFAVFFPAVTGIMAGVNMSGDLRNPRRSIPRGTLAAIAVSYVLYMTIPLVLESRASRSALVNDPLIMRQLAIWGPAVVIGVWGATLSSALGSMLGAPRILQALARDGVLPGRMKIFGRGSGENDEPRLGTYLSLALALAVVMLGDLDAVAPILTMFFLATYAVVNFVSAGEQFLRNPSFRPTFRIHWSISMLGAFGCVAVMILINPVATVVAVLFVSLIWALLNRRRSKVRWGDIRQGIWINLVRWAASHVRRSIDSKNWRPNILVLAGSPTKRWYLIELANALSQSRGLLTVATILPEPAPSQRKRQLAETVRDHLSERDVNALVRVVSAPSPYVGASVLVEAYGLGSLMPNTVVLGDGETTSDPDEYATMVQRIHDAGRNVVVVRAPDDTTFGERRQIDVWLRSIRDNGALMIVLADTLRSSKLWRRSKVTVRMVVPRQDAAEEVSENLRELFTTARIRVEIDVIVDERPVHEVIGERAESADLTLVGLPDPCVDQDGFAHRLEATLTLVSTERPVAFVLGSNDVDLESLLT